MLINFHVVTCVEDGAANTNAKSDSSGNVAGSSDKKANTKGNSVAMIGVANVADKKGIPL